MLTRKLFLLFTLLSILVRAANSVPTNILLTSSSVNENVAVSTVVGSLSSVDVDVLDVHTYSLVAGVGATDNASFTIVGNQLRTNSSINYESQNSYSIRLQSNDGNGGVFEKIFAISVNNLNDIPTNIILSATSLNENIPNGSTVATISSTDEDVADAHTYSLVVGVGSTDNASFMIAGNQLKANALFNYEVKTSYQIRLQTNDGNGGTYSKAFTISIQDVNETPVYRDSSFTIAENIANSSVVATVLGSDVDAGQTLSYSIVSGNTGGAFAINSSSGVITVASSGAVNFEVTPVFNLVVRATDNGVGNLFDNATITINLTNVNDAPVLSVPGNQSVNEFTNLSLTPISLNDEDAGVDSLSVTLSVSHGLITLNSVVGLSFSVGDGSNDVSISFKGKLANINSAISSILYKSFDDYVGNDALNLSVNDLGHNGSGGAKSDVKAINIAVNAIPVVFVSHPVGATICETRHKLFFVNTTGTNPMTYQWQKNFVNIPGATNDTFQIVNASSGDEASYRCVVTNPAGTFNSSNVSLIVDATPQPSFTYNEVCVGGTTSFTNSSLINYDNIASYQWDFNNNNASSILENPSRVFSSDGTFNVMLIATSDLGCSDTIVQQVVVNPYPQTNFVISDICFVDSLRPQNTTTINTGTVSSLWTFGDGSTSIKKNPAHKYVSTDTYILTLQSTSNKGCSTSKTQSITVNPSPIANFVVPDICDSTVAKFQGVSSISSGTIVYFWDFGDGDTSYNNVNPKHLYDGTNVYQVRLKVVSDKMCEDSVAKDIEVFPNPSLKIDVADVSCYAGTNGVINIESTQGMAPYFYSINGGSYTLEPIFKKLSAHTYHIKVLDNRNCITERDVVINEPDLLKASVPEIVDVKCFGAKTGSYTVAPEGGTAPYSFYMNYNSLDTAITAYLFSDTGYFVNLGAKTYPNIVIDNNGCKLKFNVSVSQSPLLVLTEQHNNVSCKGFSDAEINLTASGGAGNYSYSIDGGVNYQWNNKFSNLIADDYLVSVKDTNGCGVSFSVNVIEPSLDLKSTATVDANVACKGDSSAEVSLSSVGGTGVIKYSYADKNSFASAYKFYHLFQGNHLFFAKDENACIDSVFVNITEPASKLTLQNVVVNDVSCFGAKDATLNVLATGGTGALKYSLANYFQNSSLFTNLDTGVYIAKVKDANGCVDAMLTSVHQPNKLVINNLSVSGVNCKNDISGSVNFNVNGGVAPYVYNVGDTTKSISVVSFMPGGDYLCVVRDANFCKIDTSIQIPYLYDVAKANFHPFIAGKVITFNNSSTNAISYEWNFGDGFTSTSASPIHAYSNFGVYQVKLKVTNNCNVDSIIKMVNIGSVGVEVLANKNIQMYPNPCDNELFFNVGELNNEINIEVIDMLGAVLYQKLNNKIAAKDLITISTSDLSSGKYLLRVYTNDYVETKSFEVIH